jgi:CHASE2 domain
VNYPRIFYRKPGNFLPNWQNRLQFLVTVGLLMFASSWLGHNLMVEPFSKWYHDFELRRLTKVQERFTRIVQIDEDDHDHIFGGKLPLDGGALVNAVCSVSSRGPAIVVVDLDTSNPREFTKLTRLPDWPTPVVWAADLERAYEGKHGTVIASPVLGGKIHPWPPYGLATMPSDFDGAVRFWRRYQDADGTRYPTLPWRSIQEYCRDYPRDWCPVDSKSAAGDIDTDDIPFINDVTFMTIRLSEFFQGINPTEFPAACPAQAADPRLEGRIVVLGGRFSRSDAHLTPWAANPLALQSKPGAELVASAIEQGLVPRRPKRAAELALVSIEFFLAIVIGVVHHWIRPIPATILTLVLIPVGIVMGSEALFWFGSYEVGIVPFIVGCLIHQLVGAAERAEHVASELEEMLNTKKAPGVIVEQVPNDERTKEHSG